MADELPEIPDHVKAWVGKELTEDVSDFEIEKGHIEATASAVEWGNPLYWDDAVAKELTDGQICPPTMLSVWMRPHHWAPGRTKELQPLSVHFDLKREMNLPEAIITANDLTFGEPVRPGDKITSKQTLLSISEPKRNKLGLGRYWVIDVVFTNQHGDWVGTDSYNCFGYRRDG